MGGRGGGAPSRHASSFSFLTAAVGAARERLAGYVAGRATRAGLIARELLGCPAADDGQLRDHLISGRLARIGLDGSVGGSFADTAWGAIELDELGAVDPARDRMVDWLLARQGMPGAFHEGCTAARHGHRACVHFLGGFFAPAAPARRAAPIAVPNGLTYRAEASVRFVLSAVALEAVVGAGRGDQPLVARHLASFAALLEEWRRWGEYLAPDLAFQAIRALAAAGGGRTLDALLDLVAERQLPDGTWALADLFNALDALSRVVASPRAATVLVRAVPALLARQRDDGSFGSVAVDERSLIGARVLACVSPPATPLRR